MVVFGGVGVGVGSGRFVVVVVVFMVAIVEATICTLTLCSEEYRGNVPKNTELMTDH